MSAKRCGHRPGKALVPPGEMCDRIRAAGWLAPISGPRNPGEYDYRDLARRQGIDRSGYKLLFNVESGGGQVIFHLHLHLLGGRPLGGMVKRP